MMPIYIKNQMNMYTDYIYLGKITQLQLTNKMIHIKAPTINPSTIITENLKEVAIKIDSTLVPFHVLCLHKNPIVNRQKIPLKLMSNYSLAIIQKNQEVFLKKDSEAIAPLTKKQSEIHRLINYEIYHHDTCIGIVTGFNTIMDDYLLECIMPEYRLDIPFDKYFIKHIVHAKKTIYVHLPDNYIDCFKHPK